MTPEDNALRVLDMLDWVHHYGLFTLEEPSHNSYSIAIVTKLHWMWKDGTRLK